MTDTEILDLVCQMRAAQREYFRTRDRGALQHSKSLEAKVDKAIAERAKWQGSLI